MRRPSSSGSTILVVSKRTGLSMHTLRAWERRYGFPRPERRPGSNRRLYASADVDRLLAIKRALESGYRIGDVIDQSVSELERLAAPTTANGLGERPPPETTDSAVLIELLKRDDVERMSEQLRRFSLALGPKRFVTEIAQPLARAVGDAWARGEISVRHEHVATECLFTSLRVMFAGIPAGRARPVVLLATPPGELHGLALLLVAVYVAASGATPRLLGPSTPIEDILAAAHVFRADVVGIGVLTENDLEATKSAIRSLRRRLPSTVALWAGGGCAHLVGGGARTRVVQSWGALDEALAAAEGGPA